MTHRRNTTLAAGTVLAAALWLLNGCSGTGTADASSNTGEKAYGSTSPRALFSGTQIVVALGDHLSSESAHVGDAWHGTVTQNVTTANGGTIPPGSDVTGVVVRVTPAERGSRALLQLGVRSIRFGGQDLAVRANAAPVIAGSTRTRNVGAIAGSAIAGALIGKSVGDGRNAAVGGLIGGAAATGVVAQSKGFQVEVSDRTVMTFTVSETVAMR